MSFIVVEYILLSFLSLFFCLNRGFIIIQTKIVKLPIHVIIIFDLLFANSIGHYMFEPMMTVYLTISLIRMITCVCVDDSLLMALTFPEVESLLRQYLMICFLAALVKRFNFGA